MWVSLNSPYLKFIELHACLYLFLWSNWGSFWTLLLWIFSLSLSLPLLLLGLPQCIFRFCLLFFNLFLFHSSDLIIAIVLPSCLLIRLPAQICLWITLVNFSFHILYFSFPEFLFGFFFRFSFSWYFHFIYASFSWLIHVFF